MQVSASAAVFFCFLVLFLVLVVFVSIAAAIIVGFIAAVIIVGFIAAVIIVGFIAVVVVVVAPRHRRHLLLPLLPLDNLQTLFPAVSTFQTDAHKRLLVIVLGQTVNVFLSLSWGRQ